MTTQREGRTWHEAHHHDRTFGQRVADSTAHVLGSWPFIIAQTVFVSAWVFTNIMALVKHWDPYPFILLNLMFSVQAAYAGPVLMMSQNRQAERDRYQAKADYDTNVKAEVEIEEIQEHLREIAIALERIETALVLPPSEAAEVE